jgi:hypothetical protein
MQTQSKLDIVDEKYQRTLVYGIICMITGKIYVGATHRTLEKRIEEHIRLRNCSAWQILERGNYKVYVIQKWPCNTLREKLTLEGGWQRAYKASFPDHFVNKQIEGVFYAENPEASQAYAKQYHEEHKEVINARSSQYREGHKDERQVYDKQYREGHKEEIQARHKKPWTCEYCNKTMTTNAKSNHKRLWCKNKPSE